jgi:hypothetical protein
MNTPSAAAPMRIGKSEEDRMSSRWVWGLVLATSTVGAPLSLAAQAELGIKGGASFGGVSNKGLLPGNLDNRTGFAGGVAVGVRARVIGFGVEGLWAQRGLKTSTTTTSERKLDYIDIPAYLKVQLPTPGISPFAYAGPQVAFEIRCRDHGVDCPDASTDGRKTTDYAGIIGGGIKIGNEKQFGFSLEGRYIYGLRDLKLSTVTSGSSFKTRSFMILAGIVL